MSVLRSFAVCSLLASLSVGCDDNDDPELPPGRDLDASAPNMLDGGGDGGVDPGALSCMQLDQTVNSFVYGSTLDDLRTCATSEDCESFPTVFTCRGSSPSKLEYCPVALADTQVDAGAQRLASLEDELCGRLSNGCFSSPQCKRTHAECVSSLCTPVAD